jgi:hypothetical protein
MLLPAIALDAAMTVADALRHLARHGLWADPRHPIAAAWIEEQRVQLTSIGADVSLDDMQGQLRRDARKVAVAIRRQYYNQVLWYARPAAFVLERCLAAAPDSYLLQAVDLHESDSRPAVALPSTGEAPQQEGVVLSGALPVAVNFVTASDTRRTRSPRMIAPAPAEPWVPSPSRGGEGAAPPPPVAVPPPSVAAPPPPVDVSAWPLIEAPRQTTVGVPFTVVVGLAADQQVGVTGGPVVFETPANVSTLDVVVELTADGVDAVDGWTRPLAVPVADPTSARATFTLVGRPLTGPEPVHLTTIDARYVLSGTVCGTASVPLEIWNGLPVSLTPIVTPWSDQPATATAMTTAAGDAADLTIEIFKPDRNVATGSAYLCRIYSPHPITADRGPHPIDFGQDTKTFARTMVDRIRPYAADPIVNKLLESYGSAVAEKLPDAVHDALYEVADLTAPNAPAVLIVSAEPYVPWELARLDPPLDETLPPYLGVQTLLGRWLRDAPLDASAPTAVTPAAAPAPAGVQRRVRVKKPPVNPPGSIPVRHMAVMAGVYKMGAGVAALPNAEQEAQELVKQYDAIPLAASSQSLLQLLDARLEHRFEVVGGAGAVHFAGHGSFNPASPDSSVLLLSDGKPLSSDFFRSAKYGDPQQPLIFLNACMVGIGGELLGDMGGFPGNCLKGGFGGVLGALWEVDDAIARDIALEFWTRALPARGEQPEPVAAILRDLRARYAAAAPIPTYLAYVYYGHPRLTLQRMQ